MHWGPLHCYLGYYYMHWGPLHCYLGYYYMHLVSFYRDDLLSLLVRF
jgi:hypothetical protein